MTPQLPSSLAELQDWTWPQIEPHYTTLAAREVTAANLTTWLADWSRLRSAVEELANRLYVATTVNTADASAAARFQRYLDDIYPASNAADQRLKDKLLATGLEPDGMAVPVRKMRAESELFRAANLPLLADLQKLNTEYDRLFGAHTVTWDGEERTTTQVEVFYRDPDRERRERAWRAVIGRELADRQAINALWRRYFDVRRQVAANAGFGDDYRAYRWQQLHRFDYTPADCERFHEAIEAVAVPAAERLYAQQRRRLGVDRLRPWDTLVDARSRPPLRPFDDVERLIDGCGAIFERVDPQFGAYFNTMRQEGLLDLGNRPNKAPGGYCTAFPAVRRPFIFMNAVGTHTDVQTLLHEAGHSFHVFESGQLPYNHQLDVGAEFAEVASMGMELLAAPYLGRDSGGFYDPSGAARARAEQLQGMLRFWPYMAVVDAFQHWAYTHPDAAMDPDECDAAWDRQHQRFTRGVDWSGLEVERATGWHRKLHIHQEPFYYIEYGLAQLGAVQVWRSARADPPAAVARYRRALALGGTAPLPDLYAAAGARLTFDAATLRECVDLVEATLAELDPA